MFTSSQNYPRHSRTARRTDNRHLFFEPLEDRRLLAINVVEAEPNNATANANPIERAPGERVIISGRVNSLGDRDWFRFELNQGDVFGAALNGQNGLNPAIRLVNAAGELIISNDDSYSFGAHNLPPESPLPRNQNSFLNSEIHYVINTAGTYYLEVAASDDASTGQYNLDTMVARPGLETQPVGTKQVLFLDFDGAKVNFSQWDIGGGTTTLSPLAHFLPAWGLTAADENAVIDAILARVTDKLSTYVRANGLNGDFAAAGVPGQFDIEIRNSRDHLDEFRKNSFVSRVVVGGTFTEASLPGGAWGWAQYGDVGNFKTDDEAVATLEFVTGGLATIPIQPPATVIDFVSVGIAWLVVHEAGHIFGCMHTDLPASDVFAGTPNVMDPHLTPALGPDMVFGTMDDLDLQFGMDILATNELFRGINDTLNTVSFGLSTGKGAAAETTAARSDAPSGDHSDGDLALLAIVGELNGWLRVKRRT